MSLINKRILWYNTKKVEMCEYIKQNIPNEKVSKSQGHTPATLPSRSAILAPSN